MNELCAGMYAPVEGYWILIGFMLGMVAAFLLRQGEKP